MKPHDRTVAALSALVLGAVLLNTGCNSEKSPLEPSVREFEIAGIVHGVDEANATVTVEHEDVPGFMPSMTMPFTAKNPKEIAGLRAGDAIRFDFVVTSGDSWIRKIRTIDAASLHLPAKPNPTPPQSAVHRLREGDSIPAFQLVDQKERAISPETFAGRSLLLTFIFTRCPVPNFCPLLSRNFERLQQEIQLDPALADRVRLLSISFDPEFDTPQILDRYGKAFTEGADFWRFATGEPAEIEKLTRAFSVYVQAEDGTLNHGLCTALVDPDGVITKIWRGNAWRTEEVMEALKAGFTPAPESATDFDADQGARSASRQD